jgi:hypothetical protein
MGQKIKCKEIETSGLGLAPDLENSLKRLKYFNIKSDTEKEYTLKIINGSLFAEEVY